MREALKAKGVKSTYRTTEEYLSACAAASIKFSLSAEALAQRMATTSQQPVVLGQPRGSKHAAGRQESPRGARAAPAAPPLESSHQLLYTV